MAWYKGRLPFLTKICAGQQDGIFKYKLDIVGLMWYDAHVPDAVRRDVRAVYGAGLENQ